MDRVAKKRAGRVRNPLEPLMTVNGMLLTLLVGGLIWGAVAALIGRGEFLGWGRADICAGSDGGSTTAQDTSWLFRARPGVNAMQDMSFRLCAETPSATQRWWYSLENLPGLLTLVAVVLLTYLALRQAQLRGLYTPGIATRLRILGWFLVADSALRPTIERYASHKLWATMAEGHELENSGWNLIWLYLFAGLALLSLARIMHVGSAMREDLEGVV